MVGRRVIKTKKPVGSPRRRAGGRVTQGRPRTYKRASAQNAQGGAIVSGIIQALPAIIKNISQANVLAKKIRPVTQARSIAQALFPKQAARFRARQPGLVKGLEYLQRQGYGVN